MGFVEGVGEGGHAAEVSHADGGHGHGHHEPSNGFWKWMAIAQANAVPLLSGILVALIWANTAPESYERILSHHGVGLFGVRAAATMSS